MKRRFFYAPAFEIYGGKPTGQGLGRRVMGHPCPFAPIRLFLSLQQLFR